MNSLTINSSKLATDFQVLPLNLKHQSILNGTSIFCIESGAARRMVYATTSELRALAHLLTVAADHIDIVPEVAK